MAENSKISWTDHTWNPWIGCSKVSTGCAFCYAEEMDTRRFSKTLPGSKVSHWGRGAPRYRTSEHNWNDPARWNKQAGKLMSVGLQGRRARVFCASLADWLDDEVHVSWLADALVKIHAASNLDWLMLTKRPENFFKRISDVLVHWGIHGGGSSGTAEWLMNWREGKAPSNVWFGVSAEDQETYNGRASLLLSIPSHVRWLSCEPLLGPIDFNFESARGIEWVVLGGESREGKDRGKARPCNLEWIRSGIAQCKEAQVKCFVKQVGSVVARPVAEALRHPFKHPKGSDMSEWPEDIQIQEWPASPADSDPHFKLTT